MDAHENDGPLPFPTSQWRDDLCCCFRDCPGAVMSCCCPATIAGQVSATIGFSPTGDRRSGVCKRIGLLVLALLLFAEVLPFLGSFVLGTIDALDAPPALVTEPWGGAHGAHGNTRFVPPPPSAPSTAKIVLGGLASFLNSIGGMLSMVALCLYAALRVEFKRRFRIPTSRWCCSSSYFESCFAMLCCR